jgi:hypothetical protein
VFPRLPLIAAIIAATALPDRMVGQTVAGLALDDSSHAPLPSAVVRLVDRNERPLAEARTTSEGLFYLNAPGPGAYRVVIHGADRGAFRSWEFELPKDSTVEKAFEVPRLPLPLRAGPFADEVDQPAKVRTDSPVPRFPTGPRDRGERGRVVAFVLVRSDGKPDATTLHLIESNSEFGEAVRHIVPSLRWTAAQHNGKAVAEVVQVTFAFGFAGDHLDGDVIIAAIRQPR